MKSVNAIDNRYFKGVVYNLSVADNHSFLISSKDVVAHNCPLPFGALGAKFASKTVWKGKGRDRRQRVDVENPNPGQRPRQIHYQDSAGIKYLYDPQTKRFIDAPRSVNKLLRNPEVEGAIKKAMRYLGEP